jgi:exopolysaccharide production protein ExoZ
MSENDGAKPEKKLTTAYRRTPEEVAAVQCHDGRAIRLDNEGEAVGGVDPSGLGFSAESAREKIVAVQAMRGIASLLVVFWHASRYFGPYGTGWSGPLFQSGADMGVDLFFLISGFIMVVTTRNNTGYATYAGRFMIRRFARIWPPYVVATTLFLALIPTGADRYIAPGGLSRFILGLCFIPASDADTAAPVFSYPPLPVGWTLNYEMYFYVIFGVSLLFGRARWITLAAWIAITLWATPYFLAANAGFSIIPSASYGFHGYMGLITSPMILIFASGVVIGIIYQSRFQIDSTFSLTLAILLVVSITIFQFVSGYRVGHGISQWGLSLIPLLLVVSVASKAIPMTIPRPLIYLGDISFSLYIFHPMVQEGFDRYTILAGQGRPSGFSAFFLTSALSIVVAAISHRYLEIGLAGIVRDVLLRAVPQRQSVRPITETS